MSKTSLNAKYGMELKALVPFKIFFAHELGYTGTLFLQKLP